MYRFIYSLVVALFMASIMLVGCTGDKKPDSFGYYVIDSGKFIALEKSRIYNGFDGKVVQHKFATIRNSGEINKIVIYGDSVPSSPVIYLIGEHLYSEKNKITPKVIPKKVDAGKMVELTFNKLSPGEYVLYDNDDDHFFGRAFSIQ